MIPNTDINCGKCAAPIYSDCVMWSGGNLPCVTLLQDCCDTSLTTVITSIGNYMCSITNVGNYTIPVCMESYNITDFVGMQNAMMDLICKEQTPINLSGLTWGCTTSGNTSGLQDSMQAMINAINLSKISYLSSQFSVVYLDAPCSRTLRLVVNSWTKDTVTFGTNIEYLDNNATHTFGYLVDSFKRVSINITVKTTDNGTFVGSGVGYKKIFQLPTYLYPAQAVNGNHFLCYAYIAPAGSTPGQPGLGTETVTVNGITMSKIIRLNGLVDTLGWVYIEFPFNASYVIYFQNVSFNLNS